MRTSLSNAKIHGGVDTVDIVIGEKNKKKIITVSDEGSGIKKSASGKSGNTGIGLYIVQKTIERYGGSVRFEPNKPKGSSFVIEIPNKK